MYILIMQISQHNLVFNIQEEKNYYSGEDHVHDCGGLKVSFVILAHKRISEFVQDCTRALANVRD